MLNEVLDIISDHHTLFENKKIVIFGTGRAGKNVFAALRLLYFEINYFVDNDQTKQGTVLFGTRVESPTKLAEEDKSNVIIVIASMYYYEISKQLTDLGYVEKENYFSLIRKNDLKPNESTRNNRIINGISIGKYSYGVEKHCFQGSLLQSVGAFCSINENVLIGMINHPHSLISTHPFLYKNKNILGGHENVPLGLLDEYGVEFVDEVSNSKNGRIYIGNDVLISAGVIILPGVTIGNGAIIAAGAVVNKDVPDYAVVAGVPAKLIKYRFSSEEIEILNRVKWWDWSDGKIAERAPYLKSPRLFFSKFSVDSQEWEHV